jgi:ABC-2 type transport system ATP-binding protein
MNSVQSPITDDSPNSTLAIATQDLTKTYRTGFWLDQRVVSLQNCTLQVAVGQTFGLLGQNGAGKTTLLKLLLGITRASSGTGKIFGRPLGDRTIKHRLGYLPENPYFYDYLTGWEFLQYTAGLFGISRELQRRRIPELLDLVGLAQATAQKKFLKQYSKGMLQRIGMAQALINDPELVFLDEPMSGLDPLGRYQIREIILSLKTAGKTVFFNSHVLSEVEQICDRIGILAGGKLICQGSINELLGTADTYRVKGRAGSPEVIKRWLPDASFSDNHWSGHLQGDLQEFLASLRLMEAQLISLNLARPSLEEFFVEQLRQLHIGN